MKKTLLLLLTLVTILLTAPLTVFGESSTTKADILNQAGLFKGTDKGYELEKEANRTEALIMLIRLLGEEDAALSSNIKSSFSDVPEWASAYVGYAEKNGLTSGIGNAKFGSTLTVKPMDYATFLLRGLGYSEKGGDFTWTNSLEKLKDIGVIKTTAVSTFNRGTMADWSYEALMTNTKGTDEALIKKLGLGDVCTIGIKKENYKKPSGDTELCAKFDFNIPKEYNYHDYYILDSLDTAKNFLQGAMSSFSRFYDLSQYENDNCIEKINSYYYGGTFIKQVDEFPVNCLLILDETKPFAVCAFERSLVEPNDFSYKALLLNAKALNYPDMQDIRNLNIEYDSKYSLVYAEHSTSAAEMLVFSNLSNFDVENSFYSEDYANAITIQYIVANQRPAFDRQIIYYGNIKNSVYVDTEALKQAGATEIYVAFTNENGFVIEMGKCDLK